MDRGLSCLWVFVCRLQAILGKLEKLSRQLTRLAEAMEERGRATLTSIRSLPWTETATKLRWYRRPRAVLQEAWSANASQCSKTWCSTCRSCATGPVRSVPEQLVATTKTGARQERSFGCLRNSRRYWKIASKNTALWTRYKFDIAQFCFFYHSRELFFFHFRECCNVD